MTSNNGHIRTARAALQSGDLWANVPPSAEKVQLASAHAALVQAEALTEIVCELRALREAVSQLGEQIATPLAMQATARRWFRRRPHTVESGDSA